MEQLLAFLVFGILGAITVYGMISSQRASNEAAHGKVNEDRPMVGVAKD